MSQFTPKSSNHNVNGQRSTSQSTSQQIHENSTAAATPRDMKFKAVLRCRGLPWSCTIEDIQKFFQPIIELEPNVIHIVRDFDGRVTGQAFVEFPDAGIRDQAQMELHRKHIGDRYLELYKATDEEFDHYLRRSTGSPMGDACPVVTTGKECIRLRGLPFSANETQICRWFEDHGYTVNGDHVAIGYYVDGKLTGEAWVLVDDKQEMIDKMNKKVMGRRYIEVFPALTTEFEQAKIGHSPGNFRQGHYSGGGGHHSYNGGGRGYQNNHNYPAYGAQTYGSPPMYGSPVMMQPQQNFVPQALPDEFTCLRLRGLPYHANENNIVDFFAGFHMKAILPSTVPINSRPSGEAYVEFHGADECTRAFRQKNGAMMDRRYIELFPSSKQEMDWAADGMDPREIRKRLGGGR